MSDDIIVCDTGSSDDTINIARECGARVFSILWEGYGKSKNTAIGFARHDWILSLDSDEKIDKELFQQLYSWKPDDSHSVYQVLWKNFLGEDWIKHSDWRRSWKNRLFNKQVVAWDDAIAHEDILSREKINFKRMGGFLEHYSFTGPGEYQSKMDNSARLTAIKYFRQHKNSGLLHLLLSPAICFVKTYFIRLGFLDGKNGWLIATTSANYTFKKYWLLRKLNRNKTGKIVHLDTTLLPARVVKM